MNRSTAIALVPLWLAAPPAAAQCPGDLNGDRAIDGADLGALLAAWGPCGAGACAADLDASGTVDGADLGLQLAGWGACPPSVPAWATLLEATPDPAVVTNAALRSAIAATGLAWRVRDTATQIEMLLVPPGTYARGCLAGSLTYPCTPQEAPAHLVTLTNAFYLGRHEVTQAQWQARMGSNPSSFAGQPDSPSRPVERVSWTAVQGFLAGAGMRLPTEAEWEYACRAGTQSPFYNGSNDDATLASLAWYEPNAGNRTHAVGQKAANALGFHDMLGNVYEWVSDWYGTYASGRQTNPTGGNSSTGGLGRVVRGGSWFLFPQEVRSSARTHTAPSGSNSYTGFRAARNP